MPRLSTSEAYANVRMTRQETRNGSAWLHGRNEFSDGEHEDKTDPRFEEDILVAAIA